MTTPSSPIRRIKARAIERCGELLAEIAPASGSRTDLRVGDIEPQDGAVPRLTRKDAARGACLSDHQRVTALRVANVPKEQFDALVDSRAQPVLPGAAMRRARHPQRSGEARGRGGCA